MKKILSHLGLFLALVLSANIAVAQDIDIERLKAGRKLFRGNCGSCHMVDKKSTGPALNGAVGRWQEGAAHNGQTGEEALYAWIKNWNTPVEQGNPYAVEMAKYDVSVMTVFEGQLDDAQISDILYYTENYQALKKTVADATAAGDVAAPTDGDSTSNGMLLWVLIGLLIVVALVLGRVSHVMGRLLKEKNGEPVPNAVPLWKNKKVKTLVGLVFGILVAYVVVDGAIAIGRQQGYQPDQPIAFSHKLHAGTHKIECQYCHSTVEKSKHANIPSVNICMNCHKVVQEGPTGETKEIAKIYDAIGYDPETGRYSGETKPVEWKRIHNLPDHVYFNHSQHVKAGGIECTTCHGPIQEMEEVYQYAPLSMGWCLNCHRQTEVQFTTNEYYDEVYERYHDELKSGDRKKVTVEDIGGAECQKCHY